MGDMQRTCAGAAKSAGFCKEECAQLLEKSRFLRRSSELGRSPRLRPLTQEVPQQMPCHTPALHLQTGACSVSANDGAIEAPGVELSPRQFQGLLTAPSTEGAAPLSCGLSGLDPEEGGSPALGSLRSSALAPWPVRRAAASGSPGRCAPGFVRRREARMGPALGDSFSGWDAQPAAP